MEQQLHYRDMGVSAGLHQRSPTVMRLGIDGATPLDQQFYDLSMPVGSSKMEGSVSLLVTCIDRYA